MAEIVWLPRSPLPEPPARASAPTAAVLAEVRGLSLVQVSARRGRWSETSAAAREQFGVAPPERPAAVLGAGATLLWSGPHQFLVLTAADPLTDPLAPLRPLFAGAASLVDQSHGRSLLRLSGPRGREVLARLVSVDLDEAVFPVGAAAATVIDHVPVNLWREADAPDGGPLYSVLVPASFAASLLHAFVAAGAEYVRRETSHA